jgi:hypothetical protein
MLNSGVAPGSLWDAIIMAGNEMLLSKPGIVPLHSVTACNALHYIYQSSGRDRTRRLAILQGAGWVPLYRQGLAENDRVKLDQLEARPTDAGSDGVADIFRTVSENRRAAAAKVAGFLERGGSADEVFAAVRRVIFHKGNDAHQYKYGAAIWEESRLASDPRWQAPLVAAAMAYVPGASSPDNPLMKRVTGAIENSLGARS